MNLRPILTSTFPITQMSWKETNFSFILKFVAINFSKNFEGQQNARIQLDLFCQCPLKSCLVPKKLPDLPKFTLEEK